MSADHKDKYAFEAEWYDKVACITKKFYLYYYPSDNTVELFDLKTRKTFLRRTICEGFQAKDFHVNAVVTLFSRTIKILGYANTYTKTKLETQVQNIFVLIKPDVLDKLGEILQTILNNEFHINNMLMMRLTPSEVESYYPITDSATKTSVVDYLSSAPVVVLALSRENGLAKWRELAGPEDSEQARKTAPSSLRASYGIDEICNAVYGSEDPETAAKELRYFFSEPRSKNTGPKTTAVLKNCTCCIIKPHAVQARLTGAIIDDIQKAGFTITALQKISLDLGVASEFLEIYREILPDFSETVAELYSGPCVIMEITQKDHNPNIVADFRNLCGPLDPDIARRIKPDTLRAKYGKTKIENAVHCSDLPEDGVLEVQYFFAIY